MSRNKLYSNRVELCLNDDQKKIIKDMAKKLGMTINETVRRAIMEMRERIRG